MLVTLLGLAVLGCWTSLLPSPVSASAGAWSIEVSEFRDGPNEYSTMSRRYLPDEGTRFLWAVVSLSNTTAQKRRFNWDRCDLDDSGDAYLPGLVLDGMRPGALVDIVEPRQQLERVLIFSFPEEKWPTRLKCGDVLLPLELSLPGSVATAEAR